MEININVGTYDGKLLGFALDESFSNNRTLYSFPASTSLIKTIHRNGRYLFIGGSEEIVKVYDIKRRIEQTLLEQHSGTITQIQSHTNFIFTSSEDGNVNLWRNKSWDLLNKFECSNPVMNISIHESGKVLACATKDQKLHLYNLMNLKRLALKKFKFHIEKIHFISQNDEIQFLLFQSDRRIYIVNCDTNKVTHTIDLSTQITDSILSDSSLLLSDHNGVIYLIKLNIEEQQITHEIVIKYQAHSKRVKQMYLFELNEQTYLTSISTDGDIKLWDCLLYANEQYQNIDLKNKLKPLYTIKTNQRLTCLTVQIDQAEKIETEIKVEDVLPKPIQIKNKPLVNRKKTLLKKKIRKTN